MVELAWFTGVLVLGGIVLSGILAWHEARGAHLKGKPAPAGIVSLALADPGRSETILRSWHGEGVLDTAHSALRRDFVLIGAYVAYLVALAWLGAGVAGWSWTVIAGLAVAAGLLDVLENVLLWGRVEGARSTPMRRSPAWTVRLTQVAAYGKFAALVLAALALLAVPGLVLVVAVVLAWQAVAARLHESKHDRERARTFAAERRLLESRHGTIPDEPPADIDDPRWRPGCDLVLKGGVTSGVIYPPAVLRLARDFRFRSIGGTSAGAIAAGCAAAAEYSRRRGAQAPGGGFTGLAAVHRTLGQPVPGADTLVRSLFQPERRTSPLLRLFQAAGGERTMAHKAGRVLREAVAVFWFRALLIALGVAGAAGVAVLALGLPVENFTQRFSEAGALTRYLSGHWLDDLVGAQAAGAVQRGMGIVLAILVALAAVLAVTVLTGLVRLVRVELPANLFGICSGRTPAGHATPALTDWLAQTIDRLAFGTPAPQASPGSGDRAGPLTFGMLWDVADVAPDDIRAIEGRPPLDADIVLDLVTTCLTEARPMHLPYDLEDFWFAPSELRRLFPSEVVDHLVGRGEERREVMGMAHEVAATGEALLPMPWRADLPVVVAVRMSLSLPLILSAVPLWHRHGDRLEHCWFSDGGVTSNFPIHLFDSPVPRRPTFAFNLRRWNPGVREPVIEVAERFDEGAEPYWLRIGGGDLGGFVSAVMDSARSWADETLSRKPGYRERIAHIYHSTGEGGMNLDMDAGTITALGNRGYVAAAVLAERYLPGAVASEDMQVSWNTHRWARAAITLAAMGEYIDTFVDRWNDGSELAGQPSYAQLVSRGSTVAYPPQPFPLTALQQALLRGSVRGLAAARLPLRWLEAGRGQEGAGRRIRRRRITLLRPSSRR